MNDIQLASLFVSAGRTPRPGWAARSTELSSGRSVVKSACSYQHMGHLQGCTRLLLILFIFLDFSIPGCSSDCLALYNMAGSPDLPVIFVLQAPILPSVT
ncbi:uncharacterized protein BDV14DRAFT_162895 [Aspergillus stella-maris]|uniref:uncharacterized protein n=1 Tax=Aspergillus stella-maris TaxID=1810926 RepID=UPI003CCCE398